MLLNKISRRTDEAALKGRKLAWGLIRDHSPNALPVYIVGAQRSGTNMLGECLNRSLNIEYFPEKNQVAFNDYSLREDNKILNLIRRSRHPFVVFKPLKDSHRVSELLQIAGYGKVLWMYRGYEDRANSAVNRFGEHNLNVLRDLSEGRNCDVWQAQGLLEEDLDLVRSFDYASMKPGEAAVLFWYLRNKLYFNQNLDKNDSVSLVCYEDLVRDAEMVMNRVCEFIGCGYSRSMVRHVFGSSVGRNNPPEINHRLKRLCDNLLENFKKIEARKT